MKPSGYPAAVSLGCAGARTGTGEGGVGSEAGVGASGVDDNGVATATGRVFVIFFGGVVGVDADFGSVGGTEPGETCALDGRAFGTTVGPPAGPGRLAARGPDDRAKSPMRSVRVTRYRPPTDATSMIRAALP